MKVLVSTKETQGKRKNDFCWVPEGELVMYGMECDRGTVDDRCGCRRSMVGVESKKATTTMKVVDRPDMTREYVENAMYAHLETAWAMSREEARAMVEEDTTLLLDIAEKAGVGTVVERRGRNYNRR